MGRQWWELFSLMGAVEILVITLASGWLINVSLTNQKDQANATRALKWDSNLGQIFLKTVVRMVFYLVNTLGFW